MIAAIAGSLDITIAELTSAIATELRESASSPANAQVSLSASPFALAA